MTSTVPLGPSLGPQMVSSTNVLYSSSPWRSSVLAAISSETAAASSCSQRPGSYSPFVLSPPHFELVGPSDMALRRGVAFVGEGLALLVSLRPFVVWCPAYRPSSVSRSPSSRALAGLYKQMEMLRKRTSAITITAE